MGGIAVVIPTLNEAEAIGGVIAKLPHDIVSDIIVADSGSTDGTPEVARAAGARVLALAERPTLWPLLVESGYTPTRETINVGITGATTTPENLIIAASAMAAIPTIIFFLIFQRNILSGLTAGGLKG